MAERKSVRDELAEALLEMCRVTDHIPGDRFAQAVAASGYPPGVVTRAELALTRHEHEPDPLPKLLALLKAAQEWGKTDNLGRASVQIDQARCADFALARVIAACAGIDTGDRA